MGDVLLYLIAIVFAFVLVLGYSGWLDWLFREPGVSKKKNVVSMAVTLIPEKAIPPSEHVMEDPK